MALVVLLNNAPAASRLGGPPPIKPVADAITEIDLDRADELLQAAGSEAPAFAIERARLSIYRGSCDLAAATLSNPELTDSKQGASLKALADRCARATVSANVVEDRGRGVWVRLQDDADRALLPFLFEVAARSRDAVEGKLGVHLPRPLRIDLVRDLFSLSAVSGLPLKAAETTGTLAVARWGRVIMLSPRALPLGFPWQDTMAHEITHLLVTRATRDHAPLWLQEGTAKRFESTWREERPFDDPGWAEHLARRALLEGRSVGLDRLGASIAMLPTPEAASIAFAEVTCFLQYLVKEAGEPALRLLLIDLKGVGDKNPDRALLSVTGYTLSEWSRRWQAWLLTTSAPSPDSRAGRTASGRDVARRVRLSDLLMKMGHAGSAAQELAPVIDRDQRSAAVRFRGAAAWLGVGDPDAARAALGDVDQIDAVNGSWFALHGRLLREVGKEAEARRAFGLGIAVDPLAEDVACEGHRAVPGTPAQSARLPRDPAFESLCRAARARVLD